MQYINTWQYVAQMIPLSMNTCQCAFLNVCVKERSRQRMREIEKSCGLQRQLTQKGSANSYENFV
jgi:hypothetical protein